MDYTVHRPGDCFYFVAWRSSGRRTKAHIQRPRASKGWTYCGLRTMSKADRLEGTVRTREICRNCARAFFEETFAIYAEKSIEIPKIWLRIWKISQGELEPVYDRQEEAQEDAQATIRPGSDTVEGHLRNALQIAQARVELGTAELSPAEAFEAFVSIRDRVQAALERVQLLDEALDLAIEGATADELNEHLRGGIS